MNVVSLIRRRHVGLAVLSCTLFLPVTAQTNVCENALNRADFAAEVIKLVKSSRNRSASMTGNMERVVPVATQSAATSAAGSPDSVVNSADLVKLASLALGGNLGNEGQDKKSVTLTLSPFAWQAALNKDVLWNQHLYEEYENWRRINGSVSFFGHGQMVDLDGDGTPDPARQAQDVEDVVSFEVRARLWGDRDRRSRANLDLFRDATEDALRGRVNQVNLIQTRLGLNHLIEQNDWTTCPHKDIPRKNLKVAAELVMTNNGVEMVNRTLFEGLDNMGSDFSKKAREVVDRIDGDFLVTAVVGGTVRKEDFGGDDYLFGLRSSWSLGENNFNGDFEYHKMKGTVPDKRDYEKFKLGIEAERQFDFIRGGRKSIMSLGVAYELLDKTPSGSENETAKASLSWKLPVTDETAVTVSATWANNTDLLDGADEIVGHMGFSFDYGDLLQKLVASSLD